MKRAEVPEFGSPESIRQSVQQHQPAQSHTHHDLESVREADYKGRKIVIRTTYRIEVDGKPVEGHLGVTNDGQVHYHAVPNMSFSSAVDMVQQVIDTFPDDFPLVDKPEEPAHGPGHEH